MLEYLRQMDSTNYILVFLVFYLILLILPSKNLGKSGKSLKVSLELATKETVKEALQKLKCEEIPFFVGFGDGDTSGENGFRSPPWYFIKLLISGLSIFSVSPVTSMKELILKRIIGINNDLNEKKSFQEIFKILTNTRSFR